MLRVGRAEAVLGLALPVVLEHVLDLEDGERAARPRRRARRGRRSAAAVDGEADGKRPRQAVREVHRPRPRARSRPRPMKPSSGESAPEREHVEVGELARGRATTSRARRDRPGGRPVRSTSVPPCGAISWSVATALTPATCRGGTSPSSSSFASTSRARLLGLVLLGVDHELRRRRRLVGVVDSGEALDLAGERLRVEALDVASRALLDRRRDVHLDERPALLDHRARLLPRLLVGRDRGGEHGGAVPRRAATRPSRCARCSCRGPPSRSRGPSRGACGPCRRRGTRPCSRGARARGRRGGRSSSSRRPRGR